MKLLVRGAIVLMAFSGCAASSPSGTSSSTGGSPTSTGTAAGTSTGTSTGSSTGGTSGGSVSTSGGSGSSAPTFTVQRPAGQTFASVALSAAGGEAELFYTTTESGMYTFELQHLAASGSALGSPVQVASGMPQQRPATSVTSDGREVACCWEDYGLDPNPYDHVAPGQSAKLVVCNSVAVGGSNTDLAMDGGFIATGSGPVAASNSGNTIVVYQQFFGLEQEQLYQPWGHGNGFGGAYVVTGWSVVPVPSGFDIFTSDGGQLAYTSDDLQGHYEEMLPFSIAGAGVATFASASSGDAIGLLVREGAAVASTVMSADAGTVSAETVLSAPGGTLPLSLAAAACGGGEFGFAYALTGGNVMFREVAIDGTPVGAASTLVADLGVTATGIALAPGDGGLLLAVGTSDKIEIFGVACP